MDVILYLLRNSRNYHYVSDRILRLEMAKKPSLRWIISTNVSPSFISGIKIASRTTENGDIVPLEHQDRSLWDQNLIDEGL
ncbi:MAG: DUF6596 domain-containing protein [Balneolales bacterium]